MGGVGVSQNLSPFTESQNNPGRFMRLDWGAGES
jgi:hypothetical protein